MAQIKIRLALAFTLVAGGCSDDGADTADGSGSKIEAGVDLASDQNVDRPASEAGPPKKGSRLLAIDVNEAAEKPGGKESFHDSFNVAKAVGVDFITLPLNWRDIEPGPDDDFHYSSIDLKRWTRTLTNGTLDIATAKSDPKQRVLRWTETGAAAAAPHLRANYTLGAKAFKATLDVNLVSATLDGTEATLLVRFSGQAGDFHGNRCKDPADAFAALVFTIGGAKPFLAYTTCEGGTLKAPVTASAPADKLRLVVERTDKALVFGYRHGSAAPETLGSEPLSTALSKNARPYIYFGNPKSGTVEVEADSYAVTGGAVTFDNPAHRFSPDPGFDILAIVNQVHGALPVKLALSIRTINTNQVELPSDLCAKDPGTKRVNFDGATMKARFKAFLDHLYSRIPDVRLLSLSLGNEVDGYLSDSEAAWKQYAAFIADVLPYAREQYVDYGKSIGKPKDPIVVGVKAQLHGLVDEKALKLEGGTYKRDKPSVAMDQLVALNEKTDVVMATYYPLKGDFTVQDPEVVAEDLKRLVDVYDAGALAGKPIYLLETGYPSAGSSSYCPTCNSSQEKQAQFVGQIFAAWDRHQKKLLAVNFNWLTDLTKAGVAALLAYYGVNAPTFAEFLRTLGLRLVDATEKKAFVRLRQESGARGW